MKHEQYIGYLIWWEWGELEWLFANHWYSLFFDPQTREWVRHSIDYGGT